MVKQVKSIDFRPLLEKGFSEETLKSLIFLLLPQIQKELMVEVMQAFSEEEKKKITKEGQAKRLKKGSEEAGQFILGKYEKKTGKKFENRIIQRLQEYLTMLSEILERSVESLVLVGEMKEEEVVKLKKMLDEKDFLGVNQFLEEFKKNG
jgi:Rps23 Pro-64 3,4-dihydroxylase Tpa1-like proline 4-hydroxylase